MCSSFIFSHLLKHRIVAKHTHVSTHPPSSSSKVQATGWVDIRPRSFDFQLMGVLSGPNTNLTWKLPAAPPIRKKKPPLPERKFIVTFQALIFRVFSCWFQNLGIPCPPNYPNSENVQQNTETSGNKPGNLNFHYGLPKNGTQKKTQHFQLEKSLPVLP